MAPQQVLPLAGDLRTTPSSPPYASASVSAAADPLEPTDMSPFDMLELDSLFPSESNSSRQRQQQEELSQHYEEGFGAQDALVASLDELDALEHDLLMPLDSGCCGSSDTSSRSGFELLSANSNRDCAEEIDTADPAVDALPTCPPVVTPVAPVATPFALFAQERARAFTTKPQRPAKSTRRIRPKEQIEILQEAAASLERDLEALKSSIVGQKRKQPAASDDDHQANTSHVKATAIQTLDILGLETNRRLRKTVRNRLKLSTRIENALNTQANDPKISCWVTTEKLEKQMPVTNSDYVAFYEALAGKLDVIYHQLDDVFTNKSLLNARVVFQDAQVIVNDADRLATLQFRDEKILPFSFQSVCDAIRRSTEVYALDRNHPLSAVLPQDGDVLLLTKALPVPLEDAPEVAIPVRIVFIRFLSKNRMALCWEGTTEWPCELTEQSAGARSVPMREKGWGLIQPMPSGLHGGDSGLCHIRICVRMKPGLNDERMTDVSSQVQQLTELVIPTWQQLIAVHSQMVENMLLDKYL